jgi:AFG3 family protein
MVPALGTINYANDSGYQKSYSARTGKMIDDEVKNIIDQQYKACREVILKHKDKLEALAERLLEKETIALPDIVEILGPRPFPLKASLLEYLEELKDRIVEDE